MNYWKNGINKRTGVLVLYDRGQLSKFLTIFSVFRFERTGTEQRKWTSEGV